MARRTKRQIMAGVEGATGAKIIDHNTVQYSKGRARVIRLHLTDIITFNPDGSTTLNSGGWQTPTTKDRLNKFSGFDIWQANSIWYVDNKETVFADGITIWPGGKIEGAGADPAAFKKLNKKIDKYVKGYMTALVGRELSAPSGGDCWDCSFKDENGQSMGDLAKSDHLLSHFEEAYFVPSLLVNALEEFGASVAAKSCVGYWLNVHDQDVGTWADFIKVQVAKYLRRYLRRRLGMAA